MRYFANPCANAEVVAAMTSGELGFIATPAQGNRRPEGAVWCADNGCFGKGYPGDAGWLAWLERKSSAQDLCVFATAPDVVGDSSLSLPRSLPWLPEIRRRGYLAALVAQNGLVPADVPWPEFDVLFLGGSPECIPCGYIRPMTAPRLPRGHRPRCPFCAAMLSEWKLSAAARVLVTSALEHDKRVHMGRVNSGKRIREAVAMGCHTADGTFLTFSPTRNLARMRRWLSPSTETSSHDPV